jgi:hypothetical protein
MLGGYRAAWAAAQAASPFADPRARKTGRASTPSRFAVPEPSTALLVGLGLLVLGGRRPRR